MGRIVILTMVFAVIGSSSFAQLKKNEPKTITFIQALRAGYEIKGITPASIVLQKENSAVICQGTDALTAPCKVYE